MQPRYCCVHEFCAALFIRVYCALSPRRFRCVKFEQSQNKCSDFVIISLQMIRFYYDLEASAALMQLLLRFIAL